MAANPPAGVLTHITHGFPEEDLRTGGDNNPGYFSAWLGMSLSERYCIMCKLGWGKFSNVWLARDAKFERFVAIKILTCDATQVFKSGGADELGMLQKIATADLSHDGYSHVVEYYDTFELPGPLGLHLCIVTEVLGVSVSDLHKQSLNQGGFMSIRYITTVVRQILLGLDYLHNKCGIIHTDLKFDNILLRPDDVTLCIKQDFLDEPSMTYACDTRARPPSIPVKSQVISIHSDTSDKPQLNAVIADFSHSHWACHHFQEEVQPPALRAPEVILGYGWNGAADIWSVGCLTAELLIGSWLFSSHHQPGWDRDEDHLARMTEVLEEHFPIDMLEKCEHRNKYFNKDGTFAHFTYHEEPALDLRNLLIQFSAIGGDAKELEGAVKFLKQCLRLRPESRATAAELAVDPWLVRE